MSQDLGNVAAGFADNFAYYTLTLSNSTYVKLVDDSDNSAGTGAEAVYADSVSVPAGCQLDLNGLHLYTRSAAIQGTVLDGTITPLSSGGSPLGYASRRHARSRNDRRLDVLRSRRPSNHDHRLYRGQQRDSAADADVELRQCDSP